MKKSKKMALFLLLILIVLFNFVGIPLLLNDTEMEGKAVVEESIRTWHPYHDWPRAW